MKISIRLLVLLSIVFLSVFLSVIPNVYYVTGFFYTNAFVLLYFIIGLSLIIFRVNPVSLYFLFYITFGLFIGGRFIYSFIHCYVFFDGGLNISQLFDQYRMVVTGFSYEQISYTFTLVVNWLSFSCVGFLITYKRKLTYGVDIFVSPKISKYAFWLFVFISTYLFLTKLLILKDVYVHGYLSLYRRGDEYTSDNIITVVLNILLMFTFALSSISKKYRRRAIFILFLVGVVDGLTGRRSAFVTKLFAIIITIGVFKKIDLKKLIKYVVIIYIAMTTIFLFSARNTSQETKNSNYIENSIGFLESQGTTLGVIGFSIHEVKDISLRLKLKTFIPLTNAIYTTFFSKIEFYERSIGQYISYEANSAAYMNGGGLGSSIVSESYLVFPNIILCVIFAFLFGFFLNQIESKKNKSLLFFIINISICFEVVMLPRTGLTVFFTNLFFIAILYLFTYPFIKKKHDI
ncbi:TPA: O-antigen polysaccharide polymerase Wzy [Photobacterium damselae]